MSNKDIVMESSQNSDEVGKPDGPGSEDMRLMNFMDAVSSIRFQTRSLYPDLKTRVH